MPMSYHKKINSSYLKIAKKNPSRFVIIDAMLGKKEISEIIWDKVKSKLL